MDVTDGTAVAECTAVDDALDDAAIDSLVVARAAHRSRRAFSEADAILAQLVGLGVSVEDTVDGTRWARISDADDGPELLNVLNLAKAARACAADEASDADAARCVEARAREAAETLDDSRFVPEDHLAGRTAADAAFAFAMAGCTDGRLLETLGRVAEGELHRTAARRKTDGVSMSNRHVFEKLAAAGVASDASPGAAGDGAWDDAAFAGEAFLPREEGHHAFFSLRGLVWRWRYSASKEARDLPRPLKCTDAMRAAPFVEALPLVVDLGCGFGTSIIGLARGDGGACNYLGVDSSPACIRVARGFAERLGVSDRCRFVRADSEDALRWAAAEYGGGASRVLVQFPTPCAVGDAELDVRGKPFMFTVKLAGLLAAVLGDGGELYVSSNVEDVALRILDVAASAGFAPAGDGAFRTQSPAAARETKRRQQSNERRCVGAPWLEVSPLPLLARTETEGMLLCTQQPVHRAILRVSPRPDSS